MIKIKLTERYTNSEERTWEINPDDCTPEFISKLKELIDNDGDDYMDSYDKYHAIYSLLSKEFGEYLWWDGHTTDHEYDIDSEGI